MRFLLALLILFAPGAALAQFVGPCPYGQTVTSSGCVSGGGQVNLGVAKSFTDNIINLINGPIVQVLFAIAFLTFLYGVYKYFILGATSEEKRAEGRQAVLWGIIGFVVIVSVWGLVNIVMATFGLTSSGSAPRQPII